MNIFDPTFGCEPTREVVTTDYVNSNRNVQSQRGPG